MLLTFAQTAEHHVNKTICSCASGAIATKTVIDNSMIARCRSQYTRSIAVCLSVCLSHPYTLHKTFDELKRRQDFVHVEVFVGFKNALR